MTKTKRSFSAEERLSILQEGERQGQASTIRKYNIAPSLYARWKNKYLKEGVSGLKEKYKRIDPAQWAQMLDDEVLATALLDRLLFHCEVINLSGRSFRMKNQKTIFNQNDKN